jgi:hypothetical protein
VARILLEYDLLDPSSAPAWHPARTLANAETQLRQMGCHRNRFSKALEDMDGKRTPVLALISLGKPLDSRTRRRPGDPPRLPDDCIDQKSLNAAASKARFRCLETKLSNEATHGTSEKKRMIAKRQITALSAARAAHAGAALETLPFTHQLVLENNTLTLKMEQRLNLPHIAAAGVKRCNCTKVAYKFRHLDPTADQSHFFCCAKANPGKFAHTSMLKLMIRTINGETNYTAVPEPHITTGSGKRSDVLVTTGKQGNNQTTMFDISTVCPQVASARTGGIGYSASGNPTPNSHLPLFHAKLRAQQKISEYGPMVVKAGHKFLPFVLETTGGMEARTSGFLNLLIAGAHEKGHPNPYGVAQRFIAELACCRARSFNYQIQTAIGAVTGYKAHEGDLEQLLPQKHAIRALGPFAQRHNVRGR